MSRTEHPASGASETRSAERRPRGAGRYRSGWGARIRRAPLGILLFAAALAIGGLGILGAAVYLALDKRSLTLWAVILSVGSAPASLYLGYHLLCLRRWAWLAMIAMIGLLLVSSLVRLFAGREIPGAAGIEILAELVILIYLLRPRVRRSFTSTVRTPGA